MCKCTRREWLAGTAGGIAAWAVGLTSAGAWAEGGSSEMIVIPAGPFLKGTTAEQAEALAHARGYHPSWLSGEVPKRRIELPAFAIDRHPVTNAQYAEFCRATGHRSPVHFNGAEPPPDMLRHPVILVNRPDARAYAAWAGKRLPTEDEWEKAARGEQGLLYPWGDEFDPEACRWNRDGGPHGAGPAAVGYYPQGASPYGVEDMAGNVAEWCEDGPSPAVGYIKGGCWYTEDPTNLRPAARNMSGFDTNVSTYYGFRCAKEVG